VGAGSQSVHSTSALIMNRNYPASIPSSLLESEDYRALNVEQQKNFKAKINYCDEIAEKGIVAANLDEAELRHAVDDIELDALSIMSGFGNVDTEVSMYKIHSSWTFECKRDEMAQYVGRDTDEFLETPTIGLAASPSEVKIWMARWGHILGSTIRNFKSASSFTEAVTHLIVMDSLVSFYLVFAARARIGGKI
jgi:hypothetical protein